MIIGRLAHNDVIFSSQVDWIWQISIAMPCNSLQYQIRLQFSPTRFSTSLSLW